MPEFRIRLSTAFQATATDNELVTVFATVAAAGGTNVDVLRNPANGRPRAEFILDRRDRADALLAIDKLLADLSDLTPSVSGGWVLVTLA